MQRSADGGETWDEAGSVDGEPYKFKAVGRDELYLALSDGTIMHTTGRGEDLEGGVPPVSRARRARTGAGLAAAAFVALALAAPGAGAHSLVRPAGAVVSYISADATSLNTLTVRASGCADRVSRPDGRRRHGPRRLHAR